MAGRNDIDAKLGVDDSEFNAGLSRALSHGQEFGRGLSAAMTGAVAGLAAGLAGAVVSGVGQLTAKLGEVKEAAVEWGVENIQLARTMGITATEASVLSIAVGDVYGSTKQLEQATGLITQKLNTKEEAFRRLGVATRDSNGNFRDSLEIFLDVTKKLNDMKSGTDRNLEGVRIFGRAWGQLQDVMSLSREGMEEARKKAEELGLVMGVESAERIAKYRAGMNDVGDVMTGIKVAISRELMPAATELSNWFSSIGPEAVEKMRQAAVIFTGVVSAFKTAFMLMYETAALAVNNTVDLLVSLAKAGKAAIQFDFEGVKAAWNDMAARNTERTSKYWDDVTRIYQEGGEKVDAIMERLKKPAAETPIAGGGGAGNATPTNKGGGAKSRMSLFEATLAEEKAAFSEREREAGRFREFDKESELSYWQAIQQMGNLSAQEQIAVRRKIATTKLAIAKEEFANDIAQQQAEIELIKNDYGLRIELAQKTAEQIGNAFGTTDKRYTQALKAVAELRKAQAEELKQIDVQRAATATQIRMGEIDAQRGEAQLLFSQKRISADQLIAIERDLAAQKQQIRLAEIAQDEILYAQEPVKLEQLNQKKLQIQQQYQNDMRQLKAQEIQNNPMEGFTQGAERALMTMGNATLGQYKSLKDQLLAMFQSIYESFVQNMIVKPLADTVGRVFRESALYKSLFASQTSGQQTASTQITATKGTEATNVVTANAAEAASGAASSQAAIPFVGPALALAAMAAVFATVMSLRSARGGYDIPAGENPITQLHESEMVLPKEQADAVRDMARGGGGGGGRAVQITAMDGESVRRVLENNQSLVMQFARQMQREGW